MRVILHIGMNKAGSSAIQDFFCENYTCLMQRGLLFPEPWRTGRRQHLELSDALGFQLNPKEGTVERADLDTHRARLDKEIARTDPQIVVISSEMFSRNRSLDAVADFFSGYSPEIVVYLRRHDHWLASRYSQALKTVRNPPWGAGIDAFIQFQRRRGTGRAVHETYAALVDSWSDVFGAENVKVRPYENLQNSPDLITDFLDTIGAGADAKALNAMGDQSNKGLSADACGRIEAVRRSNLPEDAKDAQVKAVIANDTTGDDAPRGADNIKPGLRHQLVADNLEEYAYIARQYLGRKDVRLFLEPLPVPVPAGPC